MNSTGRSRHQFDSDVAGGDQAMVDEVALSAAVLQR